MPPTLSREEKGNRARGWVLAALGPILSLAMAVIGFNLWRTIRFPGQLGNHSHWNGSPEMTFNTFALFGTIFLFGLVCTAAGIFQIRTGRKNMIFLALILGLFAIMMFFGYGVMQAGK